MPNESFKIWREKFATLQRKIDEFDENFWNENITITDDAEFEKAHAAYEIEREKMVEELERHAKDDRPASI